MFEVSDSPQLTYLLKKYFLSEQVCILMLDCAHKYMFTNIPEDNLSSAAGHRVVV